MPTGLENELLNDSTVGDLPSEEEVVTYNGNREYDAGPNTGQYGFVEVEIDGELLECTNAYMSNAYGGQYCVGDSYADPNGGTQVIRSIDPTGLDLAPAQWDAEDTYADAGEKMGMSLEEWTEFSAEVQSLNETVDGLKGNMFGPTEQERGRLGIRISQANPDWTEEQVMAEADRMLEEKWMTSEAYAEAAAAETALFEKYGIQKDNPGVYGSGIFVDADGKYHKFESSSGNYYQTSQDTSFLDVAVPIGIAIGAGIISGGAASAITSGVTAGLAPAATGAINGVLGSAISQGITTGGIDPSSLLTAALIGGIGGLADGIKDYDNMLQEGGLAGDMDTAITELSHQLGMKFDETVNLLEGVATGAINGDDLEDIALGAVGTMGQSQIMDMLKESFGDTLNVDDWFKDGQSHIPIEALEPIIGGTIQAAINGGMSEQDALKMAFDYFQAGGDVDFMLPGAVDGFKDWLDGLPGLDFEKDDHWDISFDEESNDWVINHDLPSFDFGFDFDVNLGGGLPQIGNPCRSADGQEGKIFAGALEGTFICQPDLGIDAELPQLGDPCKTELGQEGKLFAGALEGTFICEPDSGVELPQLGDPCKTELGQEGKIFAGALEGTFICEPDLDVDLEVGAPCTDPDGFEGTFILGPDGNSVICNVQLPNIGAPCTDPEGNEGTWIIGPDGNSPICNVQITTPDIGGPCTDREGNEGTWIIGPEGDNPICNVETKGPDTNCPEGFENVDGECLQIDIDIPLPNIELGGGEQGDFSASWSDLNPYTTITNPLLSPFAPKRGI